MGRWILGRTERGTRVRRMQQALSSNSFAPPFDDHDHSFEPGPIDGEMGPLTINAMRRARKCVGFKSIAKATLVESDWLLLAILEKRRQLTKAQRKRRTERIKAQPQEPLREKAYQIALSHVTTGCPVNNVNAFTKWWFRGRSWAIGWCSIFASYCYRKAGSAAFRQCLVVAGRLIREGYSDYSEQMLIDAMAGRNGLSIVTNPERGDLCIWEWGVAPTDNTSILESLSGGTVTSIDGNVSVAGYADGVTRCSRPRHLVRAFIRVSR